MLNLWYAVSYMQEILGISQGIFPFLIIIFSIILHELGHGYAAFIQGDFTAHRAGRLTINPVPHIDAVGSVVVPFLAFITTGTFFGWAKPVPYNKYNIRTQAGLFLVASAGVLTNLLFAGIGILAFKILFAYGMLSIPVGQMLFTIISVNVSLAFFNLIPVPPFDGMSMLEALFPRLAVKSSIIYNPIYMVMAILGASVLYGIMAPYLFMAIEAILM